MGTASHDGWEFYKVATFVHNCARTRQRFGCECTVGQATLRLVSSLGTTYVRGERNVNNRKRTYGKVRIKVKK